MALFKIQKGPAASLGASGNPTEIAHEGFAYFTPDDGKFYIDIEDANEAVIGENRIPINAYLADKFSSDKLITLTGDVTGTDAKDGETGWSIATTLRNSGVIGGLYGPEGNEVTNGAVVIPRLTINEKGLITGAESVEVRISGIADTKVTQDLEANNGEYFPLFTPKNQGATANTTATFNRYVKVNPYISEWTFLSNNGDSHHDTPSFILSRSNNGANLKLWGQSGDFYISSDYWINSKKTTFSEHLIKLSPANASITFQGHLLPNSSGWALGSVLAPWEAGFFNQGLMIGGNLNYGSSSLPIYWNNGIPTPITSYEGTAARAISDDDGNNIKNTYASNLTFTNGLLILKNKNGIALDTITLDTLTVSDITTGTEEVRKLITAKVFKDSVDSLISQLNVNEKTFANGEVLKTLKEENGKIGLTTGQLSIDGGILAGSYVINLKEDSSSFSQLSIGQMQGATATTPGAVGLVPQTVAGDQEKFLRGDGQWIIPTNTDYQVRQTNTGADKDYRVLLSYSDTNNEETNTVYKHSGLLYNPSSNTLTVTYIEGRAATASRANADSLGNVINTTYALKTAAISNIEWNSTNKKLVKTINGVESDIINFVAGDNITFTSNTAGLTIAATDTNTTYSLSGSRSAVNYTMLLTPSSGSATQAVIPVMTPATEDAGGLLGLVPNSAPGDQNKFLRADGTWVVPTNTNNKVQSVKTDSSDANYKILFSYTDTNSNETNYVRKDSDFYYNPSSNTLTVTQVAGNAQTASKANADSAGNIIINTYAKKSEALTSITWDKTNKKLIKTINGTDSDVLEFAAGNNVTLTADDNKITITTANDNTTYGLSGTLTGNTFVTTLTAGGTGVQSTVPAMSAASASTAGKAGLVPAPKKGDQNKFLTGAGTWVEQTVYTLPLASSSTRGGIKIGFESNSSTKNYALLLDNEKAYVNVPWTDRSVEGPGYHYVPQEDSASLLSASATGGTAEWGIDVVQGIKVRRDNRGHITGLEVISGKIPDQPTYPNDRDPGYGSVTIDTASTAVNVPTEKKNTATITAATYSERLTLSPTNKWIVMGAADNSSTGLDKIYIGHNISSVTKGSYGPSDNVTASNGGTFSVPYVSVDEAGHITGASTKTITLPTTSDTKVTQYNFTQNSDLRVILSNSATGNEETATVNKSNNLTYNPSTNILNTGNLVLSDDLSVGGDVDITGVLDVTGDVTFIKTPNAPTAAAGSNDTKLATTAFVTSALSGLIGPMRFIGTLGTGGTATALADASANNKGYTYKVITAGTYQGATVKVGDLVISNGSSWIVVPSGDEPSGTVTNIATGNGLTGGPITSTGTISHADTSSQASLTAQSKKYVNAISLDDFGHVTSIGTGTVEETDTLVKQTEKSDSVEYKILAGANSNPTSGVAYEAIYDTAITLNPNTNTITATTFKGNASSADIWKTNRKFTIGYKEQNVNGSSDIIWDLHDILKSSTNINKTSDWDIYTPGVYYVASSGAFEGNNHPGTNQNPPYTYGQMIITKANTGGIAQFYISDYASESMNTARGIRYRSGWNNNYHSWATILDDKNYNLYAVKKVTSTDNAIARFDGTTGNIQNSQVIIDDNGIMHVKAAQAEDSYSGSLNMNNSNIYGLNSIYTSDSSENASEGIHFYRDATHVDTLWINGGDLLFVPNRELGTGTTKANSQKVGRFTTNPTTGQVIIADGTTGGMKSSGYTMAANISEGVANQVAYYSAAGTISSRAPAWEAWTTGTTAGPKANINIANATITSAAIPSASATESGVVTTGAQEFKGLKIIRYTEGNYNYNKGDNTSKFYKIKINSTTSWMLTFTIRVYHNYNWNDIVISGYNYPNDSTNRNWHQAKAVMLGGNHNNEINVYFGKDANNSLWVGLQADKYTGLDIFQVTNGYTQITDTAELFTITLVDNLEGEQISTSPIKVKRPVHKGETITYTPTGTNKKSAVTIKPVTTNIYSMTSAGSVTAGTKPSLTMSVDESTETLSFTWSAGTPTSVTLPGRSSAIAAWTGYTSGVDNTYAAAQEFTGTQATITI